MGTVKGAIRFLNGAVKQADEVMESAVKSSSNSMIKAGVNMLDSNASNVQKVAKYTGNLSTTVKQGANAAQNVIDNRTVTKAMNNNLPEVIPPKVNKMATQISGAPATDTGPIVIGQGTHAKDSKFDEWAQNAIDLEPSSNRKVTRKSARKGNTTQQPETPKVIYSGQGDNPKVIYADGPTANTSSGGNNNSGGSNKNTTGTGGNSGNKQQQTNTNSSNNSRARDASSGIGGFAKEMFGGVTDTYKGARDGQNIIDTFVNAHKNEDGSVNMLRAAGTFMATSAAARVASGGGVYKDRYGNPNLIGVPFI